MRLADPHHQLQKSVDTLIIIQTRTCSGWRTKKTTFADAFAMPTR